MKQVTINSMHIGDKFAIEYGAYGNWTSAIITDIQPTETENVKMVSFTIPRYTADCVYTERAAEVDVFD
jgi:hypothetical protein